ncbi:MAG TPA: hypothetical protein VN650_10155 [Gemmatimonadaceae bacterium]|mgnify:CR=1 FL=1|nr:hypothetical protein [Gemmatimonadaceae bacterium]
MDRDVISFAGVMVIIIGSIGALGFMATALMRSFVRAKQPATLPAQRYDEQLAQLQQSVDAIAVEVERIAEAQRFSTRLLSDGARVPVEMEDR